jgi:hypothetical protein
MIPHCCVPWVWFCINGPVLVLCCCLQAIQRGALHLAATVHLGLQSDPYFTTQNQVEVNSPSTLQRARLPLEATIRISPTMQLTNGLPYDVLGWAIAPPQKEFAGASTAAATTFATAAPQVNASMDGGGVRDFSAGAGAGMAPSMLSENSETSRQSGSGAQDRAGGERRNSVDVPAGAVPAGGRLFGLQQVWAAGNKRDAELALARLVAGKHCCNASI